MGKSFLVIDTPKNCYDCPCGIMYEGKFGDVYSECQAKESEMEEKDFRNVIPDWCPLKEISETSVGIEVCIGNQAECVQSYVDGYNDCIDYILKNAIKSNE